MRQHTAEARYALEAFDSVKFNCFNFGNICIEFCSNGPERGQNTPTQIVAAHKFPLNMLGANVGDLSGKIKGENLKCVAAIATLLPLAY